MSADSTTPSALKRKVTKPLIEKRRRARINSCLAQLKDMVTAEPKHSTDFIDSKTSRLEKADILEMTVQYVKKVNRQADIHRYNISFQEGYQRCITEVAKFMVSRDSIFFEDEERVRLSLLRHLQQSLRIRTPNSSVPSRTEFSAEKTLPDIGSTTNDGRAISSVNDLSTTHRRCDKNEWFCFSNSIKSNNEKVNSGTESYQVNVKQTFVTNNHSLDITSPDGVPSVHGGNIMWRPW